METCGDALDFSSAISDELSGALGCTVTVASAPGAKVTGTITFNADSTFADDLQESGSATLHLESTCFARGGTTLTCAQVDLSFVRDMGALSGAASFACTDTNDGGCDCELGFGPQGMLSATSYTVSGTTLTIDQVFFDITVGYCVDGATLHLLTIDGDPTTSAGSTVTGDVVARPH